MIPVLHQAGMKKAAPPKSVFGSPAVSEVAEMDKTRGFPSPPRGRFGVVKAMYNLIQNFLLTLMPFQ